MRKLGLTAALTLLAFSLVACSDVKESVKQTEFASDAEAMEASAQTFEGTVQSFEARMTIGFAAGDEDFSTTGLMKYKAPDNVYIQMDIPEMGEFEAMFVSPNFYARVDGEWYQGDASALGIDLSEFEQYAQDQGLIDYSQALEGLKDLVRLSDEKIDGKMYWHYSGVLDIAALAEEMPDDVLDPSIADQASEFFNGIEMDIYIDPETLLPKRYAMTTEMSFGDEAAFTMKMSMDFDKYNEDVDMPDVPVDAHPIDLSDLPFAADE
jgi:hypothetical protein